MMTYLRFALMASTISPIMTQFCFGPGGPPYHPCCDLPAVQNKSISATFLTNQRNETTGSDTSLDVTITWDEPQAPAHTSFNVYGVCLLLASHQPATPASGNICGIIDNTCPYINAVDPEYTFKNVLFGHQYKFVIRLASYNYEYDSVAYRAALETRVDIAETPDCYETTLNKTFCESQPIELTSKPVDFMVESFIRINDTMADATVSWRQPVQINDAETLVSFAVYVTTPDGELFIPSTKVEVTQNRRDEGVNASYALTLSGLYQNTSYIVQIAPASLGNLGYPRAGSIGNFQMDVPVLEAPPTTLPPPPPEKTETATQATPPPGEILGFTVIVIIAASASAAIVFMVVVIAVVLIARKKRPEKEEIKFERDSENSIIRKKSMQQSMKEIKDIEVEPRFAGHEIDRSRLKIENKLGSGQFGIVYKAFALGFCDKGKDEYTPAAAKGLKPAASRATKEDFLDEIELIIKIGNHHNIVTMLGCITVDEPYYLVTEFMKYGDLLEFLEKCREEEHISKDPIYNLTDTNKIQIALQIARGMDYMSHTRYYHGDLAARNVLVDDGLIVKLSDFGMAEDIYERGYKRMAAEKKRPVKWVSLETNLNGKCSIESDVWSYGIVLYEIYTLGGMPYPDMDGSMVLARLQEGYRMERPDTCPNDVYDVMRKCWLEKPDERPTFEELYKYLDNKLASQAGYLATFGEREYDVFEGSEPVANHNNPAETTVAYSTQIQSVPQDGSVSKTRKNTYVDMESTKPQASRQISSEYLVMREQNQFGINAILNSANAAVNPVFARDDHPTSSAETTVGYSTQIQSTSVPQDEPVSKTRKNTYIDMKSTKPQASRQISSEYLVMRKQNQFGINAIVNTANAAVNPVFAREENPAINDHHKDTYM